ncbi:MAG: hypothetical protein Q8O55_09100 [Dehalococcoidales bacterium]|nr:hypothetical protein [Dehalococcoidales bacterium]
MAIVIRVAYNNKDWKARCEKPGQDSLCWYCFTHILDIQAPKYDDVECSGDCWEQHLRNDYKWGCTPKGRIFGPNAYRGATVFLVFKQRNGNYTIWGKTTVNAVDAEVVQSDKDYEDGFAFIRFKPFDPLTRDKWVTDVSDKQLVVTKWLQGRYRYVDANQEKYLNRLIEGGASYQDAEPVVIHNEIKKTEGTVLNTTVTQHIYTLLKEIAAEEGRSIDEIVREAIAGWLRSR